MLSNKKLYLLRFICHKYVDSYANLPSGDNFGSGETIHSELPSTYMLGEYGRSVAEAEMIARNEVGKLLPNGNKNSLLIRKLLILF